VNDKLLLPILGQPDPRRPIDVHLVGRYALGVTWADQHGSIYPFEHLRRACACGTCAVSEGDPSPPPDARATAIKKLDESLDVTWADGHRSVYAYGMLRAICRCAGCTGGH
jgi:DUF971 family protein